MRVLLQACSGAGTPTDRSASMARPVSSDRLMVGSCSAIASTSWTPMVRTGLNDVIGFWKIIPMSRPRIRRSSVSFAADQVESVEHRLAGDDGVLFSSQPNDRRQRDALSRSRLADDAEDLPGSHLELDLFDRGHQAAIRRELNPRSRTRSNVPSSLSWPTDVLVADRQRPSSPTVESAATS